MTKRIEVTYTEEIVRTVGVDMPDDWDLDNSEDYIEAMSAAQDVPVSPGNTRTLSVNCISMTVPGETPTTGEEHLLAASEAETDEEMEDELLAAIEADEDEDDPAVRAAATLTQAALLDAARHGRALGTSDED